jgi:hypothetical protein
MQSTHRKLAHCKYAKLSQICSLRYIGIPRIDPECCHSPSEVFPTHSLNTDCLTTSSILFYGRPSKHRTITRRSLVQAFCTLANPTGHSFRYLEGLYCEAIAAVMASMARRDQKHRKVRSTQALLKVVGGVPVGSGEARMTPRRPGPSTQYLFLIVYHLPLLASRMHIILPSYRGFPLTPSARLAPTRTCNLRLQHAHACCLGQASPPNPGKWEAPYYFR